MRTGTHGRDRWTTLFFGALVVALVVGHRSIEARDVVLGGVTTDWRFGGGGSLPPAPPNATAPDAPSLATSQSGGPILLAVSGPGRRVVLLRSVDGRLLDLHVAEAGEALVTAITVPAEGVLLDVLGTDVVGLPVTPGAVLRIVVP